jgi:hypothetical protein
VKKESKKHSAPAKKDAPRKKSKKNADEDEESGFEDDPLDGLGFF